jgi:RHS repeat-associated protein
MLAHKLPITFASPHPQRVPVESLAKGTRRASRQQIGRSRNRASLAANALNNRTPEKQGLGVALARNPVDNGLENLSAPAAGTIQKIHYLTGGDGSLFAMYVIDQNNQGKMYYIYTDHLGSPNLITDAECNVVQELCFDTWGNRRDPATWQPYSSLASIPSPLIDRGFTFHEHLYPFTLINMNGRAYDPLVGRFLSADPYIQAPDNPQNLNRYTYCLNNPLRYTDPSGEIWEYFVFAAFIYFSGAQANKDKETGKWEWNPLKWLADDKPGIQAGVNTSTDFNNWGVYGGTPGGLNFSYNNQMGLGLGYSNLITGNTSFYYPTYNYGAVEQNAMIDYNEGREEAIKDNQVNSQVNNKYPGIRIYESSWMRGGISLPPFGIVVEKPSYPGLKEHEYGHFLQYEEMGAFNYYTRVALPSIYNAMENDIERLLYNRVILSVDHSYYPVETDANRRSKEYFGPYSPINNEKIWPSNSKSTSHPWHQRLFLYIYFYH